MRTATALALALLAGAPPSARAAAAPGKLEDIVIKAEDKSELSTGKPAFDVPHDPYESLRATLKPDEELLLAQSPALVSWVRSRPDRLRSDRLVQPWNDMLTEVSELSLAPRGELVAALGRPIGSKELKGAAWDLSIVDEDGKPIRKFHGEGAPPESVSWNGLTEEGQWIRAGHAYSAVYKLSEPGASARTALGQPLQFSGLVHKDADGTLIGLDSSELFGVNRQGRDVLEKGRPLLRAAADWIRRRAYGAPVLLRAFGPDAPTAQSQAAAAKAYLVAELGVPSDKIAVEAAVAGPAEQRVDLLVSAR